MPIEAIFVLKGRGIIIKGRPNTGTLHTRDTIYLIGNGKIMETTADGIEISVSEYTTLLLKEVGEDEVNVGMIVTTNPHLTDIP